MLLNVALDRQGESFDFIRFFFFFQKMINIEESSFLFIFGIWLESIFKSLLL